MKILFDARPMVDAPYGGVGRVAFQLAKALLQEPDIELILFTTGMTKPILPKGLGDGRIQHLHCILCMLGLQPMSWFLKQEPDAVFFPNLSFAGTPSSWPTFLVLHDISFLIERRWFDWWMGVVWHRAVRPKYLAQQASHIFCVSRRTLDDAARLLQVEKKKMSVMPMGATLNVPEIKPATESLGLARSRTILAFGEDDFRKNFRTAKLAVQTLAREPGYEDLKLIAIGTITKPSDSELADMYSRASAMLYPSWYEGYGLPLHEAAQFGCPRIASTAGSLPETAPVGTFFANPAKPQQWVEALKQVLDNPVRDIQLSKKTWKDSVEHVMREMNKKLS